PIFEIGAVLEEEKIKTQPKISTLAPFNTFLAQAHGWKRLTAAGSHDQRRWNGRSFNNPKVQASVPANTFSITGAEENE
ncbi:hypothetical protein TELCIR_22920, partial [Teladorsagia circumcincta]